MECVLFPFFPPLFFFFLFTMNKFTRYFEHHLAIQIINIKLFVRKLIKDKERYSFLYLCSPPFLSNHISHSKLCYLKIVKQLIIFLFFS